VEVTDEGLARFFEVVWPHMNEFVFRFNHRSSRSRRLVFYRVLELAFGHHPVRYLDIVAGERSLSVPTPSEKQGRSSTRDSVTLATTADSPSLSYGIVASRYDLGPPRYYTKVFNRSNAGWEPSRDGLTQAGPGSADAPFSAGEPIGIGWVPGILYIRYTYLSRRDLEDCRD
jgi:hypothetical protein